MRRFVPGFIEQRVSRGESSGCFEGAAIVLDIPGFTSLTEAFIPRGSSGAEDLSALLNQLLEPAIRSIVLSGGFIGSFAGDSISGILPGASPEEAQVVAELMSTALRDACGPGPGSLAKAGIASGQFWWAAFRGSSRLFHCLGGRALVHAMLAQESCLPGERRVFTGRFESSTLASTVRSIEGCDAGFVPGRIASLEIPGEFRFVTSVFVSCECDNPFDVDPRFVEAVVELSERYDGYVSGLDFKPGGSNVLVLFGAPVSHEDDVRRADQFLRDLVTASDRRIRGGVESGPVFAGILGSHEHACYTAIGSSVNLSARLMYRAVWGGILAGPEFSSRSSLRFIRSVDLRVKGLRADVKASLMSPYGYAEQNQGFHGPFLGREEDLSTVSDLLEGASRGPGARVIHILGEAGAGKSRLVSECTRRHPEISFHVMQADAVLMKSLNPFTRFFRRFFAQSDQAGSEQNRAAFDEGVSALCASSFLSGGDGGSSSDLRRLAPALGSLVGLRWPDSVFERLDPKLKLENIAEAVRSFFRLLCAAGPCVIVVDDAQWLDGDSCRLLERLADSLTGEDVRWMIVSRPAGHACLPGFATDPARSVQLRLEPLDRDLVERLVEHELGAWPSEGFTDFLCSQTGGNPLFLEQYCRFLFESGRLSEVDGHLDLSDSSPGLPAGISSLLVARLDRLQDDLRTTIQAAAILGREFETGVLSGMLAGRDVGEALRQGVEEGIWQPVHGEVHSFGNALMRDAAYSMQLASRLRELHALAAAAIESSHPGDPEWYDDLAYHYEKAGMVCAACENLGKAAEWAGSRFMVRQAIDLYGRLAGLLPDGARRISALLSMAELEWNSGRWEDALGTFRGLEPVCLSLGMYREAAKACQRTGRILLDTGEEEAGLEALRRAGDHLDRQEDLSLRSQICMAKVYQMQNAGIREGIRELLEEGLGHAEASGDEEQILRARGSIGNSLLEAGDYSRALERYEQVVEGASRSGNLPLEAVTLGNMALAYKYLGQHDRATSLLWRQLRLAEDTGNRYLAMLAHGNLGTQLSGGWDWEGSLACYRRAVEIASGLGSRQHEGIARSNLAMQSARMGFLEGAPGHARKAVELVRDKAFAYYYGSFLVIEGEVLALAGRHSEALASVDEAEPLEDMEVYAGAIALVRARCLMARNESDAALGLLEPLLGYQDADTPPEASLLVWRITGSPSDRSKCLDLNRAASSGRFPWRAVLRLRELGEDVSGFPPLPPGEVIDAASS